MDLSHIRNKPPTEDITLQDICICIEAAQEVCSQEGWTRDIATFWQDSDLQHLNDARRWWRREKLPDFAQIIYTYGHPMNDEQTFLSLLTKMANGHAMWLAQQGIDTTNPNETKEDRKARLNRERVNRHRALKREESNQPPASPEKSEALAAAIEAVRQLRKDRDVAMAPFEEAAREAHAKLVEVGRMRREEEVRWKHLINEAEEHRKQLR